MTATSTLSMPRRASHSGSIRPERAFIHRQPFMTTSSMSARMTATCTLSMTDGTRWAWKSTKVGVSTLRLPFTKALFMLARRTGNCMPSTPTNGRLLWTATTRRQHPFFANLLPTACYSSVRMIGNLYAFDISGCGSASCQPLPGHIATAGSVVSSPVVANGYVYVGSNDKRDPNQGYLYAFDLRRA